MLTDIIERTGKQKGPTSIILAGVHGDERCGIDAFEKILPNLTIAAGRVFFGYGNPKAIVKNQRFTETNLNRMFRDANKLSKTEKAGYEYRRAQFLKSYFRQADALLDLHASTIPKSQAFAICEKNAKEVVKFLPVDLVVSGFDRVEPGGTDYYMNRIGKIGICLECGDTKNPQSTRLAEKGIITFLKARGHIPNNLSAQQQSHVRMFKKYFTKTSAFTLSKLFENFEVVEKDQLIGVDGHQEIKAPKRCLVLFSHNRQRVGSEAFLLGEKKKAL